MVALMESPPGTAAGRREIQVSFKADVFPILKRECLPCHAEESYNPSDLSLDSYGPLMSGGRHGAVIVAGKPDESLLLRKLGPNPPFGDRMPLDPKKGRGKGGARRLTDEEIRTIARWIDQGARDN
jgi:hypothetical protein